MTGRSPPRKPLDWNLTPFRIAAIYGLLGALWIVFSDALLSTLVGGQATFTGLQSLKGAFFILVTAVLLFALIRRSETAIRRSTETVRRSEEQLRLLTDALPVLVAYVDAQQCYRFNNRAYEDWFGRSHTEVHGRHMREVLGEAGYESIRQYVDTALSGREVTYEACVPFRDGVERWINATYVPSFGANGEVEGFVALVSDISERKRAEERIFQLNENLARRNEDLVDARAKAQQGEREAQRWAGELSTIIESISDVVFVCDAAGHYTILNAAARALLGITRVEPNVGYAEYLSRLHLSLPDGRPIEPADTATARALRGEVVQGYAQMGTHGGTGRRIDFLLSAAPLRDGDGQLTGAVVVARDVTQLAELDRLKDQFISVAAHELKTPVAVMKAHAQALPLATPDLNPQARRMLEAIDRGADRIDRIVRDLLDVTRLQTSEIPLSRTPFDLAELAAEGVARVAATAPKHQLRLARAQAVHVQADRERLAHVLAILLDNAVRYSPDGGAVEVAVEARAEEAVVSVRDHGVGIPADGQSRIFERFYRAHTHTPHDYGGLGVGLFIARVIVARHGGRMWFVSEDGKGSNFSFSLPLGGGHGG